MCSTKCHVVQKLFSSRFGEDYMVLGFCLGSFSSLYFRAHGEHHILQADLFWWLLVHFPSDWFLLVSNDKEYMHAHMLMFLKGIVMKDCNTFCCLSDQTPCLRAHGLIYSCVIKRIKSIDIVTDHSARTSLVWSAKDETTR